MEAFLRRLGIEDWGWGWGSTILLGLVRCGLFLRSSSDGRRGTGGEIWSTFSWWQVRSGDIGVEEGLLD